MVRGLILFVSLYFLFNLLPHDVIVQLSSFLQVKPHHVEHKFSVVLMLGFFLWLVIMTIRLSYHSFCKKKPVILEENN
ncbi:hypothetical protein [Ammoniphilus sp. YIM 78166]|uniref:hypothetical protein n=1 Tax=Ammoniphilus sp. YIM 78166 TaxID=1644106 RepID=UPI00106F7386|nr:hypothetical protein [Ammoniphilus sp. YIM 78166]